MKFRLREMLATLLLALIIFLAAQATLDSYMVIGASMEPNIHQGQYLLVNKVVYHLHPPERGDIIVFRSPQNSSEYLIKRVTAIPEETVEIRDGKVYINGGLLSEDDYILEEPRYTLPPQQVPADCYFVLGDNRNHSSDSHVWARQGIWLPREDIVGKAWLCYWPVSEWQLVPNYSFAQR